MAIGTAAAIGLGLGAVSAGAGLLGASKASNAQTQSAAQSNALQQQMYNQNMGYYNQNAALRDQYANTLAQGTADQMGRISGIYEDQYGKTTDTNQNQMDLINNYLEQTGWGGEQTYPFIQAGQRAVTGYENLLSNPNSITENPGYQFRLGEGTKAIERGAAAKSGQLGGAAQKALLKYGQDYGSNEYQKALANYQPLIQSGQTGIGQLHGFQSLTGQGVNQMGNQGANYINQMGTTGQNYINQMGNANSNYLNLANLYGNSGNAFAGAGTNYANAVGANNQYAGNAQASGYINQANALTGGLQSGMNNALMGYYMGNYGNNGNTVSSSYYPGYGYNNEWETARITY